MQKIKRKIVNDDSNIPSKKRKVVQENRGYQEHWEWDYLIANVNELAQCLVCLQIVSVFKEYNVKRLYITSHEVKYKK